MNIEENEIYQLLKYRPHRYLSAVEIIQGVGPHKDFCQDRNWLLAILRRMEMEGWVEANSEGEYRLKLREEDTTSFKKALANPGTPLGDAEIICLNDTKDKRADAA
jgi:hypothetical protein